jgi:hypothetical protein
VASGIWTIFLFFISISFCSSAFDERKETSRRLFRRGVLSREILAFVRMPMPGMETVEVLI